MSFVARLFNFGCQCWRRFDGSLGRPALSDGAYSLSRDIVVAGLCFVHAQKNPRLLAGDFPVLFSPSDIRLMLAD
jgi:hypothetical protein